MKETFGRRARERAGGDQALVQRHLTRSSPGAALLQIGIDKEETEEAFIALNLE
jgi:hypothetical protein